MWKQLEVITITLGDLGHGDGEHSFASGITETVGEGALTLAVPPVVAVAPGEAAAEAADQVEDGPR